jgi:CheY-like chemotaxis protein
MADDPGTPAPPLPEGLARAGILVVDDDDDIRDSLSWLLEEEGYRVSAAANGRDALALLARIPLPDVALVDLRMPVMDGIELIERLRADPAYVGLRIIAFSAASTVDPPAGVSLLRKPIAVVDLLSALRGAED